MSEVKQSPLSSIARYSSSTRHAPKVSNHVTCYIEFSYEIEREGGGPVTGKCVALEYENENLDGRENPIKGKILAQWDEDDDMSYREWIISTVNLQRRRLLDEGTITETYVEEVQRFRRAIKNKRARYGWGGMN